MGQDCHFTLSGAIADAHTGAKIKEARVFIREVNSAEYSSSAGQFAFTQLCKGEYHLEVSADGYEHENLYLKIEKNFTTEINLHPFSELIDEVELQGHKEVSRTQASGILSKSEIDDIGSKGLSQAIEGMSGVSTLSNGDGIAKPVIHGLWGNRVSIINNGITQSGQQWGTDHAPEIDPFVADHISVLKGASALAYGGSSLGGVVLVEQSLIPDDPHLHGNINYVFQSNGLGNTLNASLEQAKKWGRFRINATGKIIGDRKSPNYFLTNTGNRESNIALSYQKQFKNNYLHRVYYSLFNTEIGILRGSHISNSTDLESAFTRDEPFFTKDHFSYNIEAPKQKVQHHLLKYRGDWRFSDHHILQFRYGGQWNNRKEFDVRRSGRSDSPALSLLQINQFFELKDLIIVNDQWLIESGLQYTFVDNTNDNASTGRLPLIPDYQSHQTSAFAIFKNTFDKWAFEFGGRADYKDLFVLAISQTVPREIEKHQHYFLNYSLSGGLGYTFEKKLTLKFDLGYVQRQPEVNELYSAGLHQGLASVEYGNPNLTAENSLKALAELEGSFFKNGTFQLVGFYQNIQDYIFLRPTGTYEINISGSFPVFVYDQTNATLFGSDLSLAYNFGRHFQALVQASFLKGNDISDNIPLIFMPANNGLVKLTYAFEDGQKWRNTRFGLSGKYIAQQKHLNADQDFVLPPDSYFLIGAEAKTETSLGKNKLEISLRGDNLLNSVYRDYLNRQRYFADDLGINIQVRLGIYF